MNTRIIGIIILVVAIGGASAYFITKNDPVETNSFSSQPISQNENVRYSCMNWTQTNDSMFEPPADILFKNAAEANVEYGTVYEEGEF